MNLRYLLILLLCTLTDQVHKYYMMYVYDIVTRGTVEVTDYLNFVMVWNRGISFGMFQSHEYSNIFFLCFTGFIVLFIMFLIRQSKKPCEKFFLSIIAGGALGNIIDRIRFGAVADFFDFHYAGYHWPAFNFADSFVFIGAFGIIIYTLFYEEKNDKKIDKH